MGCETSVSRGRVSAQTGFESVRRRISVVLASRPDSAIRKPRSFVHSEAHVVLENPQEPLFAKGLVKERT
jgi:hypothetical protein